MLGDDDVCEPDRIARQVAVFDRHPDTGVAHGAASIIDGQGVAARHLAQPGPRAATSCCATWCASTTRSSTRRAWSTAASTRPSAATSSDFRLAQDFDFWLRAVRAFRFRDVPGGPLIGLRRHGDNFSDESAQALEVEEVQNALRSLIDAAPLRELVPELDWGVMHPDAAERRALEVLADAFERRALPLPGLARELRAARRARARRAAPARPTGARSSSPRSASTTRAAAPPSRAWRPRSSPAAAGTSPSSTPPRGPIRRASPTPCASGRRTACASSASTTASTACWDLGNPLRELDDPPITQAFARAARPRAPDVVHFHNLHNLGAALIDEAAAARPAELLLDPQLLAHLPARLPAHRRRRDLRRPRRPRRATAPRASARRTTRAGHQQRLAGIRDRFTRGVSVCLAVSDAMRAHARRPGLPGRDDRRRPPGRARRRRGLGAPRARPARPAAAASA